MSKKESLFPHSSVQSFSRKGAKAQRKIWALTNFAPLRLCVRLPLLSSWRKPTRTNTIADSEPSGQTWSRDSKQWSNNDHCNRSSNQREAKPELVLQTGYNNLFGATRLVFSPDGTSARNRHISQQHDQALGDCDQPQVARSFKQRTNRCDRASLQPSLLVVTVVSSQLRAVIIQSQFGT